MRPSVYLARRVPDVVRAELERRFDLDLNDSERPVARDELLRNAAGRAGLVTILTDRVDDELLDAAGPGLRIVANYAVGYDNVDVDAASRRGIVVSNTPDVLTEATAELTMALVLDAVRRVTEGDRSIRRRESWIWAPTFMLGTGLRDRVIGVVGLGRIGSEVARLAEAFGMRVIYTNRSGSANGRWERVELDELLARADVVTLHCPLTEETRRLIGREELRAMRRDAFLVNTTRGAVVDEAALAQALRAGEIAGAALDVFEREPEVAEELLQLENVVLAPHLGSATRETREAMGMLCVEALDAVLLEGRCPANAINPSAWARAT
ncbi:MAG: D-glycerate dehydrogenase [Actinobacteria bacterium]|nr:D-glycerate dehydrogenase [Actinomycetota bacterium]